MDMFGTSNAFACTWKALLSSESESSRSGSQVYDIEKVGPVSPFDVSGQFACKIDLGPNTSFSNNGRDWMEIGETVTVNCTYQAVPRKVGIKISSDGEPNEGRLLLYGQDKSGEIKYLLVIRCDSESYWEIYKNRAAKVLEQKCNTPIQSSR